MGTWGDGIYDNDSALDDVSNLVGLNPDERDPARVVAGIGLLAWLNPSTLITDIELFNTRIRELDEHAFVALPADTRLALAQLLDDPEAGTQTSARTPEARAAIGGYCEGPRIDALLRFPGAAVVLAELADRAASQLDRVLTERPGIDLYQAAGDLAALGVLIELTQGGFWTVLPARLERWRTGFAVIDKATKSERGFWWKYVRRVRSGLDLLAPTATKEARPALPSKPFIRKRTAAAEAPAQRFTHAKFGVGALVSRSGSGDSEQLELKFEDGTVRKILLRFVTPQ